MHFTVIFYRRMGSENTGIEKERLLVEPQEKKRNLRPPYHFEFGLTASAFLKFGLIAWKLFFTVLPWAHTQMTCWQPGYGAALCLGSAGWLVHRRLPTWALLQQHITDRNACAFRGLFRDSRLKSTCFSLVHMLLPSGRLTALWTSPVCT